MMPFSSAPTRWTSIVSAVLCLGLAGCGSDNTDLEQYIASIKARTSTNVEPLPQIRQYEAFEYDGTGRRNPFVPVVEDRTDPTIASSASSIRPNANRNREPLEEFPLDSLRMVGTLSRGQDKYALIQSPDGIVHRVTYGNHAGQNHGEITVITDAQIQLIEIIPDGFGGFMNRPASIALTE